MKLPKRFLSVFTAFAVVLTGLTMSPMEAKASPTVDPVVVDTMSLNTPVQINVGVSDLLSLNNNSSGYYRFFELNVPATCVARLAAEKNYTLPTSASQQDAGIGIIGNPDLVEPRMVSTADNSFFLVPDAFAAVVANEPGGLYLEDLTTVEEETKAVTCAESSTDWSDCTTPMQNYFSLPKGKYYVGFILPSTADVMTALDNAGETALEASFSIDTVNTDNVSQTFEEPLLLASTTQPSDLNNTPETASGIYLDDSVTGIVSELNYIDYYLVHVGEGIPASFTMELTTGLLTTTNEPHKTQKVAAINARSNTKCAIYEGTEETSSKLILEKTFGDEVAYDGTVSTNLIPDKDYLIKISNDDGATSDNFHNRVNTYAFSVNDETVHPTSVTVSEPSIEIEKDETHQLSAIVVPSTTTNKNVTWTSNNTAIATISSNGLVTGVAAGDTYVTATTVDGSLEAVCTVRVTEPPAPPQPTGVSLNYTSAKIKKGNTLSLAYTVTPDTAEISPVWSSSDSEVASITQTGIVTGLKEGVATIEVHDATQANLKATMDLKVLTKTSGDSSNESATHLVIDPSTDTIEEGEQTNLIASLTPVGATPYDPLTLTWTSSDSTVATVAAGTDSMTGLINGVKAGTVTITATSSSPAYSATAVVTVTGEEPPARTLALDVDELELSENATYQLSAYFMPGEVSTNAVTWTTSNAGVATVSNGFVRGIKAGTARVTATSTEDHDLKAVCDVTVTAAPPGVIHVTGVSISKSSISIPKGGTSTLSAIVLPSNATNKAVTWSSRDTSIATVNSTTGEVTGKKAGSTNIQVTTADGQYVAYCKVEVTEDTPQTKYSITYLPNGGSPNAQYSYSYTNPKSVKIQSKLYTRTGYDFLNWNTNSSGTGTEYTAGALTNLTGDLSLYAQWKERVEPDVKPTAIKFPQEIYTMKQGESLNLSVDYTPSDAGPIDLVYTTADKSIVTVDRESGKVTALKPGFGYVYVRSADGKLRANCAIKVNDSKVRVFGIDTLSTLSVKEGDTGVLKYNIYPSDATDKTVTAISSDPAVITIDNEGNYKAISKGTAEITFITNDGGYDAECVVTVYDKNTEFVPVAGLKLSPHTDRIMVTEINNVTATVSPNNAFNKAVTYKSSDDSIVLVDADGAYMGISPGVATITATTVDGGFTDTCQVTVTEYEEDPIPISTMTLNRLSSTIKPGDDAYLNVRIAPVNASCKTVTWKSLDPTVAVVSSTGVVTGISDGYTIVTAYSDDGIHSASCKITVNDPEIKHHRITYKLGIANADSNVLNPDYYAEGTSITLNPAVQEGLIFKGWYKDPKFTYAATRISSTDKEDKTFYAKWAETTYRIYYDSNGGSTVKNKTSYTVTTPTFKLKSPTKKNYKFTGWFSEDMDFYDRIEKGTIGDLELTALWAPMEYKLTYKLNGGELYDAPETYYANEALELPIPIKGGCDFMGWKLGNNVITTLPANSTGNKTLTAVWDVNTFVITYDVNGGKEVKNKTSYTPDTATFKLKNPTREGYKFAGWYDQYGEKVQSIKKGSFGDLDLIAVWVPKEYKIKYKLNGGKLYDAPVSYTIEDEIILPEPYKEACMFNGWKQGKEYVDMIAPGTTGNITISASWTTYQYPIVYKLNGGVLDDAPEMYSTYETLVLPIPTKEGYTFEGWKMGNRTVTSIPAKSTGKKTVTATWKPLTYTISYDPNGGKGVNNPTTYTPDTATFKLNSPTRAGYKFDGWIDTAGEKYTSIKKGTYGDLELTAAWYPVEYKLTYKTGGGTMFDAVEYYTIEDEVTLPEAYRDGYTFTGWKIGNQHVTVIPRGTTGNKTLTATWTKN